MNSFGSGQNSVAGSNQRDEEASSCIKGQEFFDLWDTAPCTN